MEKYIEEIKSLKENPPKPQDYDSTKKQFQSYKNDYMYVKQQFDEKVKELQNLRKQIETMNENSPYTQYKKKLKDSSLLFCSKVATFIEQVGGYVWLTDKLNEIPKLEREGYIKSVHVIKSWADTMEYNINNKNMLPTSMSGSSDKNSYVTNLIELHMFKITLSPLFHIKNQIKCIL